MDQAIGYALSQVTQAISELEPQTQRAVLRMFVQVMGSQFDSVRR